MRCAFVPPYLLEQIARSTDPAAACCADTLVVDDRFRTTRALGPDPLPQAAAAWTVHTAGNTQTLPGTPVRAAGQPESGDAAVDEAAAGVEGSLALFAEVYSRQSYDGAGAPVSLTVHFGRDYDNAFWDGRQLVFGDGDRRIFDRFTKPVDVLGHEFTHAVTEHTAGLVYRGQTGALNESMSDVFAACLKQRLLGQDADEADWLIGEGLFLPRVNARALRDMAAPGTAYDDPVLGRDPQGGHMDDYIDTTDDNGGVHLNSGIPNRAFHLAATAIGGRSWEGAGRIWYDALTGADVGPRTDFAGFAQATVATAGEHAAAVREAWEQVGVTVPSATPTQAPTQAAAPGPSPGPGPDAEPGPGPTSDDVVEVRRSGGFMGRTVAGRVDLSSDDARAGAVRELVQRVDPKAVGGGERHPDMYVYTFAICGAEEASVPEQNLTADLRLLAELVLGRP